jgi:chitinase
MPKPLTEKTGKSERSRWQRTVQMKRFFLGLAVVTSAILALIFSQGVVAAAALVAEVGSEKPAFRVVGYLPEYRLARFDPEDAKFITDLIYFAVTPTSAGDAGLGRIRPESFAVIKTIKAKRGTRILLCLGGWGRSGGFAQLSASADARKKLIDQLRDFCQKNGFDGVDLDWEHPSKADDVRNHGKLLTELKAVFAPLKLQVSIALAGWQEISPEAIAAVDVIHLMAYDARGKHSTLEFAKTDVDRVVKKGVPPEKICLGVPFYGRSTSNANRSTIYADIAKKYHPAPDVDEVDGIYFNGPKMIEQKTKLALERKLAGIMIWELGQDSTGERRLLPIIRKVAGQMDAKK